MRSSKLGMCRYIPKSLGNCQTKIKPLCKPPTNLELRLLALRQHGDQQYAKVRECVSFCQILCWNPFKIVPSNIRQCAVKLLGNGKGFFHCFFVIAKWRTLINYCPALLGTRQMSFVVHNTPKRRRATKCNLMCIALM